MAKLTNETIKGIVADWPNMTMRELQTKYDLSAPTLSNTISKLRRFGVDIEKKRTIVNWQEIAAELKKGK